MKVYHLSHLGFGVLFVVVAITTSLAVLAVPALMAATEVAVSTLKKEL